MTSSDRTTALPWYFLPMTVLVAGCLVAITNYGVRSTLGLFTVPISEANNWPREIFSFAVALQNLAWGIATPFAGAIGAYRDLPISPELAGCIAVADRKVADLFSP
jgi:hypothetical protein